MSLKRPVGSKDEMEVSSLTPLGLLLWWGGGGDPMNIHPTFKPLGVVFHCAQSGPVPEAAVDDGIDGEEVGNGGGEQHSFCIGGRGRRVRE